MSATGVSRSARGVSAAAEGLHDGKPISVLARAGLTARGVVYVLMGILALLVASGRNAQVDQKGALAQVLTKPFGAWIVGLLAAGFASYAMWRLSEAAFGVTGDGKKKGPRLKSLARAVIYSAFAYTAVEVLQGSRESTSKQQRDYAAKVMAHAWGRWLIAVIGLIVVVAALAMIMEGIKLSFMRYFPEGKLAAPTRRLVCRLGRIGTIARGIVIALTGVLLMAAAKSYDPGKASGLDGALKTLRDRSYGGVLLGLAAAGLVIFGIYALCEARYRRV